MKYFHFGLVKKFIITISIVFLSCTPPNSLFKLEGNPRLVKKINKIIQDSGININMGIKIVSIDNQKTLYSYNSKKLFLPASNNKLYTCAATLHYLGPDYKFTTSIFKNKKNLVLKGGGDPDLKVHQLDSLAKVISNQIKNIDTLYLDDSILDKLNYGNGWMWDEGSSWWVAPIGGLSLNNNSIDFYFKPGELNKPAEIIYHPKTKYINVVNYSKTVDDTLNYKKFKIERDWANQMNNFTVTGNIIDTSKIDTLERNIYDPTLFTGNVFKELLMKYGVSVKQISTKDISLTNYKVISSHKSDSLISSAKTLMFESKNLTAELFVKTIGTLDTIPGTWKTGLDSVTSFLAKEVKLDTTKLRLADGSGISRYSLTNSNQLVTLLQWIYQSKHKNNFISTLPVGGRASTKGLKDRFIEEGEMIKAKTGHLSGVSNISGYIFAPKYGPVAFSILMNGYKESHKKYRQIQNQIIKTIIYD